MSSEVQIATGLSSTVTLNDGVVMPMFGLGTYLLSTGGGGAAQTITSFAIQNGYRLIDTATFYGYAEMKRFLFQVDSSLVYCFNANSNSNRLNQYIYSVYHHFRNASCSCHLFFAIYYRSDKFMYQTA